MRIATREKPAGRTHEAAGKHWTFNPEPGTDGPNVCEVDDPAAQAIFLHPRNSNLFYTLDQPAPLTRIAMANTPTATDTSDTPDVSVLDQGVRGIREALAAGDYDLPALLHAEQAGQNRKSVVAEIEQRIARAAGTTAHASEAAAQAALILDNDETAVVQILASITDPAILAAALVHEEAHAKRGPVLDRLHARIGI